LHDLASSFATSLVSTFFFLHPDWTPMCLNDALISSWLAH
jgi:hypothetical protein